MQKFLLRYLDVLYIQTNSVHIYIYKYIYFFYMSINTYIYIYRYVYVQLYMCIQIYRYLFIAIYKAVNGFLPENRGFVAKKFPPSQSRVPMGPPAGPHNGFLPEKKIAALPRKISAFTKPGAPWGARSMIFKYRSHCSHGAPDP